MINTGGMTPEEIRLAGIKILNRELGPDGYIQFMQHYRKSSGDYTKERHELFNDMTMESLSKELFKLQKSGEI